MPNALRPKTLFALILLMVQAATVYGFAAGNSVPESGDGDGSADISGYTITNIDYTLNGSNPKNTDSLSFDIAPTAGAGDPVTVKVQLVDGGSWFDCTDQGGGTWSCTVTGVTALAADQLTVVATE
jgi:hypothetical protein